MADVTDAEIANLWEAIDLAEQNELIAISRPQLIAILDEIERLRSMRDEFVRLGSKREAQLSERAYRHLSPNSPMPLTGNEHNVDRPR